MKITEKLNYETKVNGVTVTLYGKGNTRYSQAKKTAIIQAIQSSWTEEITAEDAAFLTFVGSANFKN